MQSNMNNYGKFLVSLRYCSFRHDAFLAASCTLTLVKGQNSRSNGSSVSRFSALCWAFPKLLKHSDNLCHS